MLSNPPTAFNPSKKFSSPNKGPTRVPESTGKKEQSKCVSGYVYERKCQKQTETQIEGEKERELSLFLPVRITFSLLFKLIREVRCLIRSF